MIKLYIVDNKKKKCLGFYTPQIRNSPNGEKEIYLKLNNGQDLPVGYLTWQYIAPNQALLFALLPNRPGIILGTYPSRKQYNPFTDRNQIYLTIGGIQRLVCQKFRDSDLPTIRAPYNPKK